MVTVSISGKNNDYSIFDATMSNFDRQIVIFYRLAWRLTYERQIKSNYENR